MSSKVKKKDEQPRQASFVDTLLLEGTVVLTAKTREELAEMVNDIPADCSYGAGAVGFDAAKGMYSLVVHLNKSIRV